MARGWRGAEVELVVGQPAAGGSCIAHHDQRTYFVRGALPGERVMARVTGQVRGGRIRFAEVTQVRQPSPHRVEPPCPVAGVCGGCDLQHVQRDYQLEWKTAVVLDQLRRIGGLTHVGGQPLAQAVRVQAVQEHDDGLGWRTRYVAQSDATGRLGFHRYRSDQVVAAGQCPIVVDELQAVLSEPQDPGTRIHVALGEEPTAWTEVGGERPHLPPHWRYRAWHVRHALGRTWRVATDGFWQGHLRAADVLGEQVKQFADVRADDTVVDLYAGVGLFAAAVGPAARVIAVEGDHEAVRFARRNLHNDPHITIVESDVRDFEYEQSTDVTVLDPPRAGAGAEVIDRVGQHTKRAIVHVGCDAANTARDLHRLVAAGWTVSRMAWFDLFPMTHHVESVTLLTRTP